MELDEQVRQWLKDHDPKGDHEVTVDGDFLYITERSLDVTSGPIYTWLGPQHVGRYGKVPEAQRATTPDDLSNELNDYISTVQVTRSQRNRRTR